MEHAIPTTLLRAIFTLCCYGAVLLATKATPLDSIWVRNIAERHFLTLKQQRLSTTDIQESAELSNRVARCFTKGDAFVIVGADDALPEVLGYGNFNSQSYPTGLLSLLRCYEAINPSHATSSYNWAQPIGHEVAPLLPTVRHQEHPYNAACPYIMQADSTLSKERAVVGCVATALEQIMTYYRRTIVLQDTLHGWATPYYTIPDVLPGTEVDTRLILNNYDHALPDSQAIDAVSRLSLYCGMAAQMNWGLNESGAYVRNLIEPLQRAFGWKYVHYADSYRYAPKDWVNMIVTELKAQRPVFYTGATQMMQGHAFVVDGINTEGFFHVNWGYGGDYDGYFRLDVLATYENTQDRYDNVAAQGYFCNQELILLHPDAIEITHPDTLQRIATDIVVDSIIVRRSPHVGMYTPIDVYLRNVGTEMTTTPFGFFTNFPTDTARFAQADYIALSGTTLMPGEACKLQVAAMFTQEGNRILSISPDDVAILSEQPINVLPAVAAKLRFHVSSPEILSPTSVRFIVEATNSLDSEGRCGEFYRAFFDVGDSCRNYTGATQKADFLYLEPGETRIDTFTYEALTPSETYTFRMAYSWHTIQQTTFTMPTTEGIQGIGMSNPIDCLYNLNGQRLTTPKHKGVYIKNRKKILMQ